MDKKWKDYLYAVEQLHSTTMNGYKKRKKKKKKRVTISIRVEFRRKLKVSIETNFIARN